ncbi:alpha-ketoacid dehydrogenase subunit beta [Thalassolituus alkanivorans]|jgi:2-oxoisovalerate dehydrogenase E1 component beta subunit|uniref:alpha-ketoacid dehydrogenase subunit beta n=1 Tax=Thalassolituus alkanivorans TaxID=2881055 RepID=UPI0022873856|nr:alpha-ketoacid dehydrogenase subunit beta [Thalassolituus alkanivorans]MCB2385804.1 alpha-ketoacid dehydrogenase subunit beta [Thalassolituus alkanivorans]MCB2421654.1 alpha-ketoacid dehydrogenase subunit beta [Thalassolituus alkanivorans]
MVNQTTDSFSSASASRDLTQGDLTLVEAVNLALARAMTEDPNVVLLGEDIGRNGGVFRATQGLQDRFGRERVMDTPLAETLIAGTAIGMASQGLKPVAEIQFMGFIFPAMEQLVTHAARLRNRTRGRLHCPLVVRAPFGGGIHAPEHHSESTEALFAHIPGIRVVIPSSPRRAYGLLLSAIDDPDPVLFLEPKRLYRALKQPLVDDGARLPLDKVFILREGSDITLVSWGACIQETLEAAQALEQQGISAEVVDVATVSPLDMDSIRASVEKTGRCVIVHEAARSGGIGADISARLSEQSLDLLQAPVIRVTGFDTPMPYFRQEQLYLPQVADIVAAVNQCMSYR